MTTEIKQRLIDLLTETHYATRILLEGVDFEPGFTLNQAGVSGIFLDI